MKIANVLILGTSYEIFAKTFDDDPIMKRNGWCGRCNSVKPEIVILDMGDEYFSKLNEEEKRSFFKENLRHEIIHAFLNESGLKDSTKDSDGPWSKNEEMVDWLAIQMPKIFKVFKELDIL